METHTADLARALCGRGVRVEVLATENDPDRPPHSVRDWFVGPVRVRRVNLPTRAPEAPADLYEDIQAEARVREWLVHARPELVHVHHLSGLGLGALVEIVQAHVPVVMSLHDYWTLCPRGQMVTTTGDVCEAPQAAACAACIGRTWPVLEPTPEEADQCTGRALEVLRRADRLLVPSRAARDVFVRAGLESSRLQVLPNGIEARALREQTDRARGSRPVGLRLGVLGAVQPTKGVLELALAVILADRPGLTLEVHGPFGDYHGSKSYGQDLKRLAAGDGRIRLHGPYSHADLPRVLATLDGVAAPSRWQEVFGLSAREARAVGLPVLVSQRGGLVEMGEDPGVTYLPGDTVEDWARALLQFDFSPLPCAGVPSLDSMTRDLLTIYQVLAGGCRSGSPTRSDPGRPVPVPASGHPG